MGKLRENAFERWLLHQVAQALDGVVRHHLALAQDQHRRADLLHHLQHVRAVEDHFAFVGQRPQQAAQHQGGVDVQSGKWFVQNQQVGVVQEGPGKQDLLPHAFE